MTRNYFVRCAELNVGTNVLADNARDAIEKIFLPMHAGQMKHIGRSKYINKWVSNYSIKMPDQTIHEVHVDIYDIKNPLRSDFM